MTQKYFQFCKSRVNFKAVSGVQEGEGVPVGRNAKFAGWFFTGT